VQVAGDDDALAQLASGAVDPRQVALIDRAPRSGFHGSEGGDGEATIAADDAERVVVRVRAAQPGFLYLADLHFPGWVAEVNGAEREILRANIAFRAVEVPAGDSEVVFTYRPLSLRVGALISGLSLIGLSVVWRRSAPPVPA
jgi:hypothetical protein